MRSLKYICLITADTDPIIQPCGDNYLKRSSKKWSRTSWRTSLVYSLQNICWNETVFAFTSPSAADEFSRCLRWCPEMNESVAISNLMTNVSTLLPRNPITFSSVKIYAIELSLKKCLAMEAMDMLIADNDFWWTRQTLPRSTVKCVSFDTRDGFGSSSQLFQICYFWLKSIELRKHLPMTSCWRQRPLNFV